MHICLVFCIATGDDPEADTNTDLNTQNTLQQTVNETRKAKFPLMHPNQVLLIIHTVQTVAVRFQSKVSTFSKQRYHMPLCMNCQKIIKLVLDFIRKDCLD